MAAIEYCYEKKKKRQKGETKKKRYNDNRIAAIE